MRLLFKTLSHVPLWLLHTVGWVMGWIAFLASPSYRQRFLSNVRQAGLRPAQWLAAVGAAGQLVGELPRLWMGRAVAVAWHGEEHVQTALARGKGILFLSPHLGCFEASAQAYARRYGVHGYPLTALFRPPRQRWLQPLVGSARERPGLQTAPTTLIGVKQMLKALRGGQCVALLPDQVPPLSQGVWAPYFGKDAYTMTLAVRLAAQTGATVLLNWGERLSWGRGYAVHVSPFPSALATDLTEAAGQINAAMEQLVLQAPGQYLWGYARYKAPRGSNAVQPAEVPPC
jgi:KDO2-lipid IV(A) lauroyltransferase